MTIYHKTCPKCGCKKATLKNASMPTVWECIKCLFYWNPCNIPLKDRKD